MASRPDTCLAAAYSNTLIIGLKDATDALKHQMVLRFSNPATPVFGGFSFSVRAFYFKGCCLNNKYEYLKNSYFFSNVTSIIFQVQ